VISLPRAFQHFALFLCAMIINAMADRHLSAPPLKCRLPRPPFFGLVPIGFLRLFSL
jgi:hypothetical protein